MSEGKSLFTSFCNFPRDGWQQTGLQLSWELWGAGPRGCRKTCKGVRMWSYLPDCVSYVSFWSRVWKGKRDSIFEQECWLILWVHLASGSPPPNTDPKTDLDAGSVFRRASQTAEWRRLENESGKREKSRICGLMRGLLMRETGTRSSWGPSE